LDRPVGVHGPPPRGARLSVACRGVAGGGAGAGRP
jgi:hypothetical protein